MPICTLYFSLHIFHTGFYWCSVLCYFIGESSSLSGVFTKLQGRLSGHRRVKKFAFMPRLLYVSVWSRLWPVGLFGFWSTTNGCIWKSSNKWPVSSAAFILGLSTAADLYVHTLVHHLLQYPCPGRICPYWDHLKIISLIVEDSIRQFSSKHMNIVLFCPCFLYVKCSCHSLQKTDFWILLKMRRVYTEMLSSPQRAVSETHYRWWDLCEKLIEIREIPINALLMKAVIPA